MPIDPETLYIQLGRLIESMPDLRKRGPIPAPTHQWLGRAYAMVSAMGDASVTRNLDQAIDWLKSAGLRDDGAENLAMILFRAFAIAELQAPATAQGSFIPAGNTFDALTAMGKVLGSATEDLLIVDPYMDEKALTDFLPLAQEKISIRLLADQYYHKPTLQPAAKRWISQYAAARPLAVKLTPERTLHDRLIIADRGTAWILTQSLNAFAARSPASIVRVDNETAVLKVSAYEAIWNTAAPL